MGSGASGIVSFISTPLALAAFWPFVDGGFAVDPALDAGFAFETGFSAEDAGLAFEAGLAAAFLESGLAFDAGFLDSTSAAFESGLGYKSSRC